MDHEFWHKSWRNNEIGFHEGQPNDLLVQYWHELKLPANSVVFLPLCGKTIDISWLLDQGHRVVGIELDLTAVQSLFDHLDSTPERHVMNDALNCYQGNNVTIYQGDIFKLTATQLGSVDAVYDRAALVALPDDMRLQYSQHLLQITAKAKQLLIVFEYDQNQLSGPPFSINEAEINRHYGYTHQLSELHSRDVAGGLKGQCSATERAWLLEAKEGESDA